MIFDVAESFPVIVDYRESVEQMHAGGNYDRTVGSVTHAVFPHDQNRGEESVLVELAHFNRTMHVSALERAFESERFRVATPAELLTLGSRFPDAQRRQNPIVELGCSWQEGISTGSVLFLSVANGERRCSVLERVSQFWTGGYRFAVVRIRAPSD